MTKPQEVAEREWVQKNCLVCHLPFNVGELEDGTRARIIQSGHVGYLSTYNPRTGKTSFEPTLECFACHRPLTDLSKIGEIDDE
jgi:hypothetical protein